MSRRLHSGAGQCSQLPDDRGSDWADRDLWDSARSAAVEQRGVKRGTSASTAGHQQFFQKEWGNGYVDTSEGSVRSFVLICPPLQLGSLWASRQLS